jgi:hypothetical protein
MGTTDAPKDMMEQIAKDASLDLVPGSKYDSLIPFTGTTPGAPSVMGR